MMSLIWKSQAPNENSSLGKTRRNARKILKKDDTFQDSLKQRRSHRDWRGRREVEGGEGKEQARRFPITTRRLEERSPRRQRMKSGAIVMTSYAQVIVDWLTSRSGDCVRAVHMNIQKTYSASMAAIVSSQLAERTSGQSQDCNTPAAVRSLVHVRQGRKLMELMTSVIIVLCGDMWKIILAYTCDLWPTASLPDLCFCCLLLIGCQNCRPYKPHDWSL